jgi:hypothetical protein
MSIGEMKDLKLKMRNLHASQTLCRHWVGREGEFFFGCSAISPVKMILQLAGLERKKIRK